MLTSQVTPETIGRSSHLITFPILHRIAKVLDAEARTSSHFKEQLALISITIIHSEVASLCNPSPVKVHQSSGIVLLHNFADCPYTESNSK